MVLTDVETENEKNPYPYVLTTLDKSICLGLYEDRENNMYYPKSLRIKGNIFNRPNSGVYSVDFILSKTDEMGKFNKVNFKDETKQIPNEFLNMIDVDLMTK